MKYVDENGDPISGFYDFNLEMIEINRKREKICYNEVCINISFLKEGERPRIHLGKVCWNCKSSEYLKVSTQNEE